MVLPRGELLDRKVKVDSGFIQMSNGRGGNRKKILLQVGIQLIEGKRRDFRWSVSKDSARSIWLCLELGAVSFLFRCNSLEALG